MYKFSVNNDLCFSHKAIVWLQNSAWIFYDNLWCFVSFLKFSIHNNCVLCSQKKEWVHLSSKQCSLLAELFLQHTLISKQTCGRVFMSSRASSLLYSYSPRDRSPSSTPQRRFNHAACVNELCLVYSCVGRTQRDRSDQINMHTLRLLSLSDLLRWFKWKSSLVFMLLQMSANTLRQTVGCLISILSAD